jgi:hypothetical protein
MRIKIVYFVYLLPNKWISILTEQLDALKKIPLYDEAEDIYISIISDDEQLEILKVILQSKYNKIKIKNVFKDNVYEYAGLKTIYQIAEDEDDVLLLYFHSKGMTSNQTETRQYLFKYTIENYKNYINEFEKNKFLEVAGAIPHINGFIFFNFFWTRSSYVRNYCTRPEISDNRYIWEVWIGSEFSRKKDIITYSPIIKYDQVTHHHEVWSIHDKMINNHYCHLLNNDKSTIVMNLESEVITKPKRINPSEIKDITKPKRIDPAEIKDITKPKRIDPVEDINKPKRIDPSEVKDINKPKRIDPSEVKDITKPKRIDPIEIKDGIKPKQEEQKKVQFEMDKELYELTNLNPYTIFDRLKNKNENVIELGANIGLNTYMLSKRFKKIVSVEYDKTNLETLESNIKKYCYKNIQLCKRKLVNIKDNIKDCITFKELVFNNIHKYFQTVNLIVCEMNGKEEDILEDLFHYAYNSKVKLFIKFNVNNWKNKDDNRFNYLFNYFNYNNKISKNNNWVYFEVKKDITKPLFKDNMTIVIIGYNQYTYVNKMVNQLKNYTNDIVIIDNRSDYKPLINFYENDYYYSLLKMDKNFGHKVYEESFIVNMLGPIFIITDPDLEFNKNLPKNFIKEMINVSNEYKAGRVGFSLLIDTDDIRPGLSYAGMSLKDWEGRFWKNKIQHPTLELYSAPIDTTFCLLNTMNNIHGLSIRIAGNYICKHLPWHHNYYLELLDDEYDHYLLNNKSTNFWIDKSKGSNLKSNHKMEKRPYESEINIENEKIVDNWIIDKVKNNKCISINIGDTDINNLSDKFKLIMNINNTNICQSDNILSYNNKIRNKKVNSNEFTFKQFIYENTIYNHELNIPIKYINLCYNGEEENILEDILHFTYINGCYTSIRFNINNWNNKDINRFLYLFEFFNIYYNDKVIEISNEYMDKLLLFIPNKNISKDLFKKNMPCVIIGFNQPTYIQKMVKQLEPYTNDIIIIDNNSDFKPLLDYYNNNYEYTLFRMKINHGHKVYEKSFMDRLVGDIFFITDPDLRFNNKLPSNFIENMINISNYYQAEKVGFALMYDSPDIRTDIKAFGKSIKEWEKQYWTYKFYYPEHEIWSAAIDTTFCLLNKQNKGGHYRIAGNYLCKHLPWHNNFEKEIPKDEYEHYLKNNVSTNYWKK